MPVQKNKIYIQIANDRITREVGALRSFEIKYEYGEIKQEIDRKAIKELKQKILCKEA